MNNWYKSLKKAPWTPPSYVFGIVWPILYIMMSVSLLLVWNAKSCFPYCNALTFFFIQLFFNIIWTTLFFKYKLPLVALIDIILILYFTLITFQRFYQKNKIASYLLIPYICWLLLAVSMNIYIVFMN